MTHFVFSLQTRIKHKKCSQIQHIGWYTQRIANDTLSGIYEEQLIICDMIGKHKEKPITQDMVNTKNSQSHMTCLKDTHKEKPITHDMIGKHKEKSHT